MLLTRCKRFSDVIRSEKSFWQYKCVCIKATCPLQLLPTAISNKVMLFNGALFLDRPLF